MKGLIGKKIGMTQLYDEKGKVTPVTVIEAGPCTVIDQMTQERNGYSALQLGYGTKKAKNVSKAVKGHCAKSGLEENPPQYIREIRAQEDSEVEAGSVLTVEQFNENDFIDVIGTTKGRGFQGVVKRYNFGGGRYSHGGGWKRKPGSIGQCESPAHVDKGRKMPGHMGTAQRTIQNLKIVRIDKADNLIFIKGAIPGPNGGIVIVRSAIKKTLA
ncbi:MAG TPA: 50S ribosomal protein L3 [Victivallales bacterium]|nr:50S ribosomal protein L3 [Victivallales bacterium]